MLNISHHLQWFLYTIQTDIQTVETALGFLKHPTGCMILRGSGYLGYVDSNQGYNLYFRGLYVPKS